MAKGNHTSVYGTQTAPVPDWTNWVTSQEQLNQQQKAWQNKELAQAKAEREERKKAVLEQAKDIGLGEMPDFKPTGISGLDMQAQLLYEQALNANFDYWKQFEQMVDESNGVISPAKVAELKTKQGTLLKLPDYLASAQDSFVKEVASISDGTYFITDENRERMKFLEDAKYSITFDPKNPMNIAIVLDNGDVIPLGEHNEGKVIGDKIKKYSMPDKAAELGKFIGTSKTKAFQNLYTITESGLKFKGKELTDFVGAWLNEKPDEANSFAYQAGYGTNWNNATDEQRKDIIEKYAAFVEATANEEWLKDFDSGLAGHKDRQDALAQRKWYERESIRIKKARLALDQRKQEGDNGNFMFVGAVDETELVTEDVTVKKRVEGKETEVTEKRTIEKETGKKSPAWALKGYDVVVTGADGKKTKITINAVKASVKDGKIELWGSDGTSEYKLTKPEVVKMQAFGITEEEIRSRYKEINNETESGVNWSDDDDDDEVGDSEIEW